ncbi:MAG: hypothetical protein GXC76_04610 [Rhodanobacteraceae bacterium]|jgi:hypothetical protein|nr:hypothetical protein [Rhodanobacteraceae bacterium]
MTNWIAAIAIAILNFIFFWGVASCWHFERLWRDRYSANPPSDTMLYLGLAPRERRSASFKAFAIIGGLIVLPCVLLGEADKFYLAASVGIGAFVGSFGGLSLHFFGSGAHRIRSFFLSMDKGG